MKNDVRQLTRLSQIPQKTLEWVRPGYLAVGAIGDLSGDPGGGKSRIAYDIGESCYYGPSEINPRNN